MKDCQKNTEKHACDNKSSNKAPAQNTMVEGEAKVEMENLKRMLIRDCNITEAVEKLNSTRNYRKELMKKTETDTRREFPFLFSNPKLVSFFPNCYNRIYYVNNKSYGIHVMNHRSYLTMMKNSNRSMQVKRSLNCGRNIPTQCGDSAMINFNAKNTPNGLTKLKIYSC